MAEDLRADAFAREGESLPAVSRADALPDLEHDPPRLFDGPGKCGRRIVHAGEREAHVLDEVLVTRRAVLHFENRLVEQTRELIEARPCPSRQMLGMLQVAAPG